jgi:hypothetical protein
MATAGRGISKAVAWPYDAVLNNYGVMVGDPDRGVRSAGIESEKTNDLGAVQPTEFSYGSLDPRTGSITHYDEMALGYGQRVQKRAQGDQRYRYTINANLGCGIWQKGPLLTSVSPTSHDTQPVNRSFEMGGAFFWLNGRYVYKRDAAGVVTQSVDFGVGKIAKDVAVFWSNGGAQAYAYVAMGDSDVMWRFDGTNWVAHATMTARALLVIGRNIWRAHDRNKITLCNLDADPWVEANWAAPNSYYVGERNYVINRLIAAPGGEMIVLKEDQPWIFDLEDLDRPLYPYLHATPDPSGGEAAGAFVNDNYVSYGKGTYKITPDLGLDTIGVDKLLDNDSPVRGRVTAYAGFNTWYMFAGLYNDDDDTSYLMQHGSIVIEDDEERTVEAWHGSLTTPLVGVRITMLSITTVSAPAGHSLLVMGLSDGTLRHFVLSCTANPAACDEYRYSLSDGEVYLPLWTAGFDANQKALREMTVSSLNFSVTEYVEVDYKLDPSDAAYATMPAVFDSGITESVQFDFGTYSTIVDWRVRLRSTTTEISPLVRGIDLAWQMHTDFRRIRTLAVLAADGLVDREGKGLRYGAEAIVSFLRTAHDAIAGFPATFPDGDEGYYKVIGWRDVLAWDRRDERWRSAVQLQLAEVMSDTSSGADWNGKFHWNGEVNWG